MYLTEDQSVSKKKDNLPMVSYIGKFLRSIYNFSFRSVVIFDHLASVTFLHPWSFNIGDRFDLVFVLSVAVIVRFAIWSV